MVVPVLPGPVCQSFPGGPPDLAQHPHSAISLIRVWWSGRRASIPRSPASKAGGLPNFPTPCLVERTAGLEPAFSTPITVHRFVAGVGYVRDGRAGGPRSRVTILRGSYPVQLDDGPKIGSPTSTRTWIDRLTAGRPAVGRSGIGGPPGYRPPARRSCKDHLHPCAQPVPCRGFDPHSPALQASAFTRLAYRANWSGQSVTIRRLLPGEQKLCH